MIPKWLVSLPTTASRNPTREEQLIGLYTPVPEGMLCRTVKLLMDPRVWPSGSCQADCVTFWYPVKGWPLHCPAFAHSESFLVLGTGPDAGHATFAHGFADSRMYNRAFRKTFIDSVLPVATGGRRIVESFFERHLPWSGMATWSSPLGAEEATRLWEDCDRVIKAGARFHIHSAKYHSQAEVEAEMNDCAFQFLVDHALFVYCCCIAVFIRGLCTAIGTGMADDAWCALQMRVQDGQAPLTREAEHERCLIGRALTRQVGYRYTGGTMIAPSAAVRGSIRAQMIQSRFRIFLRQIFDALVKWLQLTPPRCASSSPGRITMVDSLEAVNRELLANWVLMGWFPTKKAIVDHQTESGRLMRIYRECACLEPGHYPNRQATAHLVACYEEMERSILWNACVTARLYSLVQLVVDCMEMPPMLAIIRVWLFRCIEDLS